MKKQAVIIVVIIAMFGYYLHASNKKTLTDSQKIEYQLKRIANYLERMSSR
jgi:hypothetical protein